MSDDNEQRLAGTPRTQMTLLDIALSCIRRGWHVFPCWPESKQPMTKRGWHAATTEESQVRAWWTRTPNANVAIACGPSDLCVVDVDHGLGAANDLDEWLERGPLLDTYAVRTGRRPEFGVQLYYSGTIPDVGLWKCDGKEGQVKSQGGYVMAAGSIHPDSKLPYEVLCDLELREIPEPVRAWKGEKPAAKDDGTPITENRNITLTSIAGKLRNAGLSADALEFALVQLNADRCIPPLEEYEVKQIARHAANWSIPEIPPVPVLGSAKLAEPPGDWRELFHTRDEILNCKPPTFLIDQFLACEGICAIAAPVAQRKSLIALNVARSLCTGAPLFGHLEVKNKPSRVLYLCPEMGLISLSDRIRRIGLTEHLGDTLFLRSMNMRTLELLDIPEDALKGSVLIIDTAIRFLKGDEQSSTDMKMFSEILFTIQRRQGPEGAILALYHSPKTTKDTSELTLENCLRGSGELGAAVTDAHGTRLQDPGDPYKSLSYINHIKPRDYKGLEGFEVSSDETGTLTAVGNPFESKAVLSVRKSGPKKDADGQDDSARAIIKAMIQENPSMTVPQLMNGLGERGIKRKKTWVTMERLALKSQASKNVAALRKTMTATNDPSPSLE